MKRMTISILLILVINNLPAQTFLAGGRTPLAVLPVSTQGVPKAAVSLDGTWEINMYPGPEIWKTGSGAWKKIQVPGEPAMQGYRVTNDREFWYRKTLVLPEEARGKTVLVRFNGVYSFARVYANGQFIREHHGGFTAWEADISDQAAAGRTVELLVGVTDRADDISYASGYAHHPIGGILRGVTLLILPKVYVNQLYIDTDLSDDWRQATLKIRAGLSGPLKDARMRFQFIAPDGQPAFRTPIQFDLESDGTGEFTFTIDNPVLWNQERPALYTLQAELVQGGESMETIRQPIGIRKVEVAGKQLLVNGQAVKLRGACRHDVHPLLGRSTNRMYDSLDVLLAKEANLNFIRTSHYPPSADFLEFADRYGLYVQEETAICFVNDWRSGVYNAYGKTYNDTAFTSRYLGQLSEMIDRDRNHPSVIMWSIGNESTYGVNFQASYDFVKWVDLSRPVSWTWPATAIQEGKRCFDIAVAHYPSYDGKDQENFGLRYRNMEHESMPLLSDEWAHVACYNLTLLRDDPNVKDFWGRSLDSMWSVRFDVPGNLGGAIWGMTDEVFHLPDTVTGYGPWGFIDVWRRKKTEFWNTRKAYSPVRVLKTERVTADGTDQINVTIKNRFNHLNFNDIRLEIIQDGKSSRVTLPALAPHEEGVFQVIAGVGKEVILQFTDPDGGLINEERVPALPGGDSVEPLTVGNWSIDHSDKSIDMSYNGLSIKLNPADGKLMRASNNGFDVLTGNPEVWITNPKEPGAFKESEGLYSGTFTVTSTRVDTGNAGCVTVSSDGMAGRYPVRMEVAYYPDGTVETRWEADSVPAHTWQIGVAYPVSEGIDGISWERSGYWSTYPAGHLAATTGWAPRHTGIREEYRVKPEYPVAEAMHDYYLTGTITPANACMQGSEAYRSTHENILSYSLLQGGVPRLAVVPQGRQAAKMDIHSPGGQRLLVLDKVDYWSLAWGNYQGSVNHSATMKGTSVIRFTAGSR